MAKLELMIDTETDVISVKIDGSVIENVSSVSAYVYPSDGDNGDAPDPHFSVTTCTSDGDLSKCEYITASAQTESVSDYIARFLMSGRQP